MSILFSLCIPTMDRFDTFLNSYLEKYINFLEEGLIDEIVINDENGRDYEKIKNKYGKIMENNEKIRVFKNDNVLGVFLNKIKVCNYAKNDYIILMDSDNFANRDYFIEAKKFLNFNVKSDYFIISPYNLLGTSLKYNSFTNKTITKETLKLFINDDHFFTLLNTGNYILTKNIINKLSFQVDILKKISFYDVVYFNLLVFQQIDNFHLYVCDKLEYLHNVHENSGWVKYNHLGNYYYNNVIKPSFKKLANIN